MQIIHHLIIDMTRPLPQPPVGAVQGDGCTRAVQITLLQNGEAWEVPAGVTAAVAFRKPDKTRGLYDRLPDGTSAVTIDGSTVTAVLTPQVLSCAGEVSAAVVFHDANLNQLASFPFAIRVAVNPAAGQTVSNDYYHYTSMEDVSEAVEAALASLEESKQAFLSQAEQALAVVHDTATADAPAIVCEATGMLIAAADASGRPLQGLTLYGKTTQDGTPTPESPAALESVGAFGAIITTVAGKNLIDVGKFSEHTQNGITFENVASGGVHVSGTSTNYANTSVLLTLPKGRFILSGVNSVFGKAYVYVQKFYADGTHKTIYFGNVCEIDGTETGVRVFVQVDPNTTVDTVIYPMLEAGETATALEPHKEAQTLTVSTPDGLPGIPVFSGGNYTDENGQAWICDEVDFGRGVYVQRVYTTEVTADMCSAPATYGSDGYYRINITIPHSSILDGSSSKSSHFITMYNWELNTEYFYATSRYTAYVFSNRWSTKEAFAAWLEEQSAAGTPFTIMYQLGEPIETALSAEELAAYAALHSNKPNTTVFNDGGAGMKLSYTADTKTYIDQKLAAISAAMLA